MVLLTTKKDFLSLKDFSKRELLSIIDFSIKLKDEKKRGVYKYRLKNKNIALIFEKTSTRTRCATTIACLDEGAHAEFLGKSDIQMGHKESIKDTARVLGRMFDAIVFRGFKQETVKELAEFSGIPVINALTDEGHPTQIIADLMTIKEHFKTLDNIKITYMGDSKNNVCNSLIIGCSIFGIELSIAAPKKLWPNDDIIKFAKSFSGNKIAISDDPYEIINGSDVVYTDVWISMGEEDNPESKDKIKILKPYQVNSDIMRKTGKEQSIFLHCLPASYSDGAHYLEVSEEVFESNSSLVFDQAENRLHTIKSILITLFGGNK